ncbi:hypothetical protein ABZ403_08365 [Micromonospora zamorensis]|uniref:hypothetical protein n=1 Tax=Micromonospora zamorensis TaxID=709883 RepID=UPI0033F08C75
MSTYAYLDHNLVISFAFGRASHLAPEDLGELFVARISPEEFAVTVEAAADLLDAGITAAGRCR